MKNDLEKDDRLFGSRFVGVPFHFLSLEEMVHLHSYYVVKKGVNHSDTLDVMKAIVAEENKYRDDINKRNRSFNLDLEDQLSDLEDEISNYIDDLDSIVLIKTKCERIRNRLNKKHED